MTEIVPNRRQFLTMSGLAAGALVVTNFVGSRPAMAATLPRWSDKATWGGTVPAAGAAVVVSKPILLDVDVEVGSLHVLAGGGVYFDPATTRELRSRGSVVVEGYLQLRPATAAMSHTLRFVGVDEAAYVGGGMDVLLGDVGLWVTKGGVLDLAGAPKRAWSRTVAGVAAGATVLELAADPEGWRVGDELAIAPTGAPTVGNHHEQYDYTSVTAISGRRITLSRATTFAHPAVETAPGTVMTPEVLNLSRNVSVEGTPGGRAHVWLSPQGAQHLSYFSLRHLGPRQADGSYTQGVVGRYGLHFHMTGEAARGSEVVGAVARDLGGHAFVAHESHGVRYTSCVSHDTFDSPFWWDGAPNTRTAGSESNDCHYDHCVASLVKVDPKFRGTRMAAFTLLGGTGNVARHCVAVGVQGNRDACGYSWPEGAKTGVWDFKSCVAHNNKRHGIFTWQNTGNAHVIEDFVAYHNGGSGISHGAYRNDYLYRNSHLFGNREGGVNVHATSRGEMGGLRFQSLHIDGAGIAKHAITLDKHTLTANGATRLERCTFMGQTGAAVAQVYDNTNGATTPLHLEIVDCTSRTEILYLRDDMLAESVVLVAAGSSVEVARPKGGPGTWRAAWNAAVSPAPSSPERVAELLGLTSFAVASSAPVLAVRQGPIVETAPTAGHVMTGDDVQRYGGVEARLLPKTGYYDLQLANGSGLPCDVTVRLNGRRIALYRTVSGAITKRLPVFTVGGVLTAVCHDARFTWQVHAPV